MAAPRGAVLAASLAASLAAVRAGRADGEGSFFSVDLYLGAEVS